MEQKINCTENVNESQWNAALFQNPTDFQCVDKNSRNILQTICVLQKRVGHTGLEQYDCE